MANQMISQKGAKVANSYNRMLPTKEEIPGERQELTQKQKEERKNKRKIAKASKKRNR
jgi:hypothetical protein